MSTDYTLNDYDLYAVVDKSKKKYRISEGGRLDNPFLSPLHKFQILAQIFTLKSTK